MSNHSHLHDVEFEKGKTISVDAYGTREECDICRERAGLPLMALVREQQAAAARGELVSSIHGGQAPDEELLKDLTEAEAEINDLRKQLREGSPELAAERDRAQAELAPALRKIESLEKELKARDERIATLEQQLAAATKKKP